MVGRDCPDDILLFDYLLSRIGVNSEEHVVWLHNCFDAFIQAIKHELHTNNMAVTIHTFVQSIRLS